MHEIASALLVFVLLLGGTGLGVLLRPLVPEEHKAHETVQLVQLVVGMLVTFAALVLGHVGKLGKLSQTRDVEWPLLFCLRLAVLLCRRRTDVGLPHITVAREGNGFEVLLPNAWVGNNPLTDYNLVQEAAEWGKVGIPYRVVYTDE